LSTGVWSAYAVAWDKWDITYYNMTAADL
jgi:hypothetical protein